MWSATRRALDNRAPTRIMDARFQLRLRPCNWTRAGLICATPSIHSPSLPIGQPMAGRLKRLTLSRSAYGRLHLHGVVFCGSYWGGSVGWRWPCGRRASAAGDTFRPLLSTAISRAGLPFYGFWDWLPGLSGALGYVAVVLFVAMMSASWRYPEGQLR